MKVDRRSLSPAKSVCPLFFGLPQRFVSTQVAVLRGVWGSLPFSEWELANRMTSGDLA